MSLGDLKKHLKANDLDTSGPEFSLQKMLCEHKKLGTKADLSARFVRFLNKQVSQNKYIYANIDLLELESKFVVV